VLLDPVGQLGADTRRRRGVLDEQVARDMGSLVDCVVDVPGDRSHFGPDSVEPTPTGCTGPEMPLDTLALPNPEDPKLQRDQIARALMRLHMPSLLRSS
jgi:hypothetical protein